MSQRIYAIAICFAFAVLTCVNSCGSSSDDGGSGSRGQTGDQSPKSQYKLGEQIDFGGVTIANNEKYPGQAPAFSFVTATKLNVDRDADVYVSSSSIGIVNCKSNVTLEYTMTSSDGKTKFSSVPVDGFQTVDTAQFPGKLAKDVYDVRFLVATDKSCQSVASVIFDVNANPVSISPNPTFSPTPIPTTSPTSNPAASASPLPNMLQVLQGSWKIAQPYREYRGEWVAVSETFVVNFPGTFSFNRTSVADGSTYVDQEEQYDAGFVIDDAARPMRWTETVTKMSHGGLSGMDVGSHRYCIFRFDASGELQARCSNFEFPSDFSANGFWYVRNR